MWTWKATTWANGCMQALPERRITPTIVLPERDPRSMLRIKR